MNSNNTTAVSQRAMSQNKSEITSKFISNSLPYINMNRSPSIKKNTAFEKNPMNLNIKQGGMVSSPTVEDLENIDISMNFLKDLSTNNNTFIYFLQLIQTHMDIEFLLDSSENSNNLYRRKTNNTISNDKITKLNNLLNTYFNILSMIYLKNNNVNIPDSINKPTVPIDNFFLYPSINNIFHKCFKIQICLNAAIMITLSQLSIYEINSLFL